MIIVQSLVENNGIVVSWAIENRIESNPPT